MIKNHLIVIAAASLLIGSDAFAQIPFEIFAGDKKASVDLMFFKFFKNVKEENTKFLFFSRARSTVDYKMTNTTNLPTFALTEAISYNHPALKGFAPVAVVQIFNRGVFPKAGIQYAHTQKNLTVFTWFVCETLSSPDLDYFLLVRFTPKLTEKVNLFSQWENTNSIPTQANEFYSITQRLRVGVALKNTQFGAGADLSGTGDKSATWISNIGCFMRHEF